MEWDGTRSDDGAGAGGVALDWVFTVEGGARVRVCRDGRGVMRGGQNESGWVGIGESLTTTETNVVPETLEMIGSSSPFPLSGRTWGLWSGGSFTVCCQRALKTLSGTDLTDCA